MVDEQQAETRFQEIGVGLAGAGVVPGRMFGMDCLKWGGKVFAGLYQGTMTFKLTGEEHGGALELPGAVLFDPMGNGRAMREWVQVPLPCSDRWPALAASALQYLTRQQAPSPAQGRRGIREQKGSRAKQPGRGKAAG